MPGITNFPAALQPILQQGYLERKFYDAMAPVLGYRAGVEIDTIPNGIGESVTKTRTGLLPTVTSELLAANNTGLSNGLTAQSYGVEQYTLKLRQIPATMSLNLLANQAGLADQFLRNIKNQGEQSGRSLDWWVRKTLFDAYMGGNTRATASGTTVTALPVDDIRGFQTVWVNGVPTPVSNVAPLNITIGAVVATVIAATPDGTNTSTAPEGISGVLTLQAAKSWASGDAVISAIAPKIFRPGGASTTAGLSSTNIVRMADYLDAKAWLADQGVSPHPDGLFHATMDNTSARQLFADDSFQRLYQGRADLDAFVRGQVVELLGIRFACTNMAPQQAAGGGVSTRIRRISITGEGYMVEGRYQGFEQYLQQARENMISDIRMVSGVAYITRPPLDLLSQQIDQSWNFVGDWCCPTDTTADPTVNPTASNAAYKRAVIIEHAG